MCCVYHGVSTGIFSNTGHCYHYPQHDRRFSHVSFFISRGNCLEMGSLSQLNSTVSN